MEGAMKVPHFLILSSLVLTTPNIAQAQVAGSTLVGVSVEEAREVATGWSAKRQVLGVPVYNDLNERIGNVDDIIIAPDKAISYAIVNAGGFLQVTNHDVAVPVSQLKLVEGKLVLPGATRDALKASPEFEYAH
jgi:sporulation protein YlmC with PRC-barrel domain